MRLQVRTPQALLTYLYYLHIDHHDILFACVEPITQKWNNCSWKCTAKLHKQIRGFFEMPYNERLAELSVLSLENIRHCIDMISLYKFQNGHDNFQASDFGLQCCYFFYKGCRCAFCAAEGKETAFSQICFHYVLLRIRIKFQYSFYVHKL